MNEEQDEMNEEQGEGFDQAKEAAASGVAALLERVVERIGGHAGAKAAFGDPVEKNGRTVIPVAQSIIGTGGGAGESEETGYGSGAGGGALTRPLGYIEVTDSQTTFVPLRQPYQDPLVVLAYSLLALVVLRALVRLVRG